MHSAGLGRSIPGIPGYLLPIIFMPISICILVMAACCFWLSVKTESCSGVRIVPARVRWTPKTGPLAKL